MSQALNHTAAPQGFGTFMSSLWASALAEAKKVEGEIADLAEELFQDGVTDFEQLIKIGMPIAIQAVLAEAPKAIAGEEKFGNAVANVTQLLEAQLGPVAMGDVQTLTQTAYRGVQQIAVNG